MALAVTLVLMSASARADFSSAQTSSDRPDSGQAVRGVITCFEDLDGDGFGSTNTVNSADADCNDPGESDVDTDCDDGDEAVFPGAAEIPDDGIDQDCNGADSVTCYRDLDQDTFGDPLVSTVDPDGVCGVPGSPSDFILDNNDCNDADPSIYPGATEIVDDGIDQDCNGTDTVLCYVDGDQDGFGNTTSVLAADGACNTAQNESNVPTDCNDADPSIYPGATEIIDDAIDQDCSGADTITCFVDADQDGYGSTTTVLAPDGSCDAAQSESAVDTDCDETDPLINPSSVEIADDGIDQNCNGFDTITCFVDADQDGFGTTATVLAPDGSCDAAQSESTFDTDCNDASVSVFPGAAEVVNDGIDQDCNGFDTILCFIDGDQDGFGDEDTVQAPDGSCDTAQSESAVDGDCNDANASIFPGAPEIADDGIDQDCNGPDTITCYVDNDQDSYGSTTVVLAPDGSCDIAQMESAVNTDCNDADPTINPGATEIPDDGIDRDCNGFDTVTCFVDGDQDGYGSTTVVLAADGSCDIAQNESADNTDCNDADSTIFPGAPEILDDGIDQDCNGADTITCFVDADQDAYGSTTVVPAADGSCDIAQNESADNTDCNDAVPTINPGATEIPGDGIDQDCSGADTITCYADLDQDGFGTSTSVFAADGSCDTADFESAVNTDCNDADATINPGEADIVDDGIDQDCSGADTVTCIIDSDQDGFGTSAGTTVLAVDGSCDTDESESAVGTDCNDIDPLINPGATEIPNNGIDEDCNGSDTVNCFRDLDGDGFGSSTVVAALDGSCDPAQSESTVGTDCADADANAYPGALETCNGADDDCNGQVDDGIACDDGSIVVACATGDVREFDTLTYSQIRTFEDFDTPLSIMIDQNTDLLVADQPVDGSYEIRRVNSITGEVSIEFTTGSIGVFTIRPGPSGDTLYAINSDLAAAPRVAEFDRMAGLFIRDLISGVNSPAPGGLTFDANGRLLVGKSGAIVIHDSVSGDFLGTFATEGLNLPNGLAFAPNGNLVVADTVTGLREYDGTSGALLRVISPGAYIGVVFGSDGRFYATEARASELKVFDWPSGAFVDSVFLSNCAPHGLAYRLACTDCDGDGFDVHVDCDDFNYSVRPGGSPNCDGVNNDCNSPNWPSIEGTEEFDNDGDGFTVCTNDCDDSDDRTYPSAPPVCDGRSNNCDSTNWPSLMGTEEFDNDGDSFSACAGDCNDVAASVFPGAPQLCDGINNDCNNPSWPVIPAGEIDNDQDGLAECEGDCNDTDRFVYTGAIETCDGKDNDCDTLVDEDEQGVDTDLDGVNNACDNCVDDFNTTQDDLDGDLVGDICDNCMMNPNPSQGDIDLDTEGDVCDQDDGLILILISDDIAVEWQPETFSEWNVYRGDMTALRQTGVYTQTSGTNPIADRFCGVSVPSVPDSGIGITIDNVAFFLVTGQAGITETDLGEDSSGTPRPNTNPCDGVP